MPVFTIAGIGLSAAGMVSGAMSQAAQAEAQYEANRINQEWTEFEKEMSLTQQRGAMSLAEFDRLFGNAMLEKESLQQQVYGQRAYREQSRYNAQQINRAFRQASATRSSSMASRGAGRGGTADAISRQAERDQLNDRARIRVNDDNQLAAYENQRNQMLKKRNMRPSNQPPTYIPATPVQPPNTSGMVAGALLGALGQGIGGLAGMYNAQQPSGGTTPTGGTGAFGGGSGGTSVPQYRAPVTSNSGGGGFNIPGQGIMGPPAPANTTIGGLTMAEIAALNMSG